ncbi:MAG: hypothetical protein AAF385_13025 [Pseudomonadota bacterium]
MYSFAHLLVLARRGFEDMLPALRRAFNDNPNDDQLNLVFGGYPRRKIVVLSVVGIVLGEFLMHGLSEPFLTEHINWSAAILGVSFAIIIRRYLFHSENAKIDDFPWLAASLIPAAVLLFLVAFVGRIVRGEIPFINDGPGIIAIGGPLQAAADAAAVIAALSIAVATLCFSRNWINALVELAVQLLVFRIMVWVTVLVFIEIGIVGKVLAGVIEGVTGFRFPEWAADFADQLSYASLMLTVYGAVVGVTWIACRQSFPVLLETGEVNVLKTIQALAKPPKKPKKEKKKKMTRKEKRAAKAKNAAKSD